MISNNIVDLINTCNTSEEANTLLKKYKNMTKDVDLHYIPKIVVDKVFFFLPKYMFSNKSY